MYTDTCAHVHTHKDVPSELDAVAHTCHPSIQEAKLFRIQGQSSLHSEFHTILGYILAICLKKQKQIKHKKLAFGTLHKVQPLESNAGGLLIKFYLTTYLYVSLGCKCYARTPLILESRMMKTRSCHYILVLLVLRHAPGHRTNRIRTRSPGACDHSTSFTNTFIHSCIFSFICSFTHPLTCSTNEGAKFKGLCGP